jgi:signal transduction histidine kinase
MAALWRGEPILLDTPQSLLPIWQRVIPERNVVLVPMRVGETLVGMLRVDNRAQGEDYTGTNKQALIRAVTRLGALVLERERLLCERAEARASELALRETQAQMDTFLGMAGHELKTPLTSMKLALQLAERRIQQRGRCEPTAPNEGAPFLEQVALAKHQAARLERLINDLLDVSRVRAGKLELQRAPTDLAAIVREAVEEQRQVNPERTLLLQVAPPCAVPVLADADRIGQVVTNYLTNALKYSPADRPVTVGLDLDEGQARVWVRDEGPGLSPEEQERIWERFHRVPGIQVQSGTGVGLGLGLHISRTIVERHQGQVGVESAPGQGSTFWFALPLGRQG